MTLISIFPFSCYYLYPILNNRNPDTQGKVSYGLPGLPNEHLNEKLSGYFRLFTPCYGRLFTGRAYYAGGWFC